MIGGEDRALGDVLDAARVGVGGKGEQLRQPLGMVDGDVEADDGAVAPADDRGLVDLERVHQAEHVRGHQVVAEGLVVARAAAVAAAVHHDDAVVLGQHRHLVAPVVGVGQPAMQQDDRRAAAELAYQIADAVDRRVAALRRRRQRRRRRKRQPRRIGARGDCSPSVAARHRTSA